MRNEKGLKLVKDVYHRSSRVVAESIIKHFQRQKVSLELKDRRNYTLADYRELRRLNAITKSLEGK